MRKALVLLAAAAAIGGCGRAADTVLPARGPELPAAETPLQVANGPIDLGGRRPLALHLAPLGRTLSLRFHREPRSGLLFDLDTGEVLWQRLPSRVLPIASLTKMMTALIVAEHAPPDAKVLITKQALAYKGSGVGVLPLGKRVRLETMLYGLLLPSGNDAAIALAQHVDGTVARFVAEMNARAQQMGLSCTHYTSPDGFEDAGNHSCAVDLAAEARAVLDVPRLAKIVRSRRAVLPFPIRGGKLWLYNNNPLLILRYPGILGIKTGFTDKAGACLVAAARRNGRRLGVVLLHSPDPARQAEVLLNRGFALRPG
jgi:serine-type D-Ala-D-Ala carboxypeptidase (penicillin-binding protein 5/6)